MQNQTSGQKGEDIALGYINKKGYQILDKNYRKRSGEIDLIARDPSNQEIVFLEVKLRKSVIFGTPEESITAKKWGRLIKTAEWWLSEKGIPDSPWRIDLITIECLHDKIKINHIQNISL